MKSLNYKKSYLALTLSSPPPPMYGNLQMICNPIGSLRINTYMYTYPFSSCLYCSVNTIYYLTHLLLRGWHFEFEEIKKIHNPTEKLSLSHEYFNSKSLYIYFYISIKKWILVFFFILKMFIVTLLAKCLGSLGTMILLYHNHHWQINALHWILHFYWQWNTEFTKWCRVSHVPDKNISFLHVLFLRSV